MRNILFITNVFLLAACSSIDSTQVMDDEQATRLAQRVYHAKAMQKDAQVAHQNETSTR